MLRLIMKRIILIIISIWFCASNSNSQLTPIIEDGKMGYINTSGEVVIQPKYIPEITLSAMNVNGRLIRIFKVPQWSIFSEGIACVKTPKRFLNWFTYDYSYYMIDSTGEELFDSDNIIIGQMHEGIAVSRTQMKTLYSVYKENFGYINISGDMVVDDIYDYGSAFNSGYALVLDDSTFYYINRNGDPVDFPFTIEDAKGFSEGLACVKNNDKWGYINTIGNWIIEPKYIHTGSFSNGRAWVFDGVKYIYIDKYGKEKSLGYLEALDFSDGIAWVKKSGEISENWTAVDTNFKELFTMELQFVNSFSNGLACVCYNGKFGFINPKGNFVIPCKYDYAESFTSGLALVWLDKQVFYINSEGKMVYDATESYKEIFDSYDQKVKDNNTLYDQNR